MTTYIDLRLQPRPRIKVLYNGLYVGDIAKLKAGNGYCYFPRNSKTTGETFATIQEVKRSIEGL